MADAFPLSITSATTPSEMDHVRRLFLDYGRSLDFELCFQDFEAELDALPGPYAAPDGVVLLARRNGAGDDADEDTGDDTSDDSVVGVVALKPLSEDGVCEMKRLYVDPDARGHGVGTALVQAILDAARARGYDVMRLDTVKSMHAARALYRDAGFEERDAYYHNPLPDVIYMEREL